MPTVPPTVELRGPEGGSALLCPQVRYWSSGEEGPPRRVTVAAGKTSARLHGLRSHRAYHAAVRAYNSAGAGPFSATVNATTRKMRT